MNFFNVIFQKVLYQPLFNGLVLLYNLIPGNDFGLAIIIFTLVIRFILYPISQKGIVSQKALAQLQPQIKEIQNKHKEKEQQAQAMIELYKKYKINPMSGCLPIIIQIPVFIALYQVFISGLDPKQLNGLYSFVARPDHFNTMFLGFINLSQSNLIFAVLVGILIFIQSKMTISQQKNNASQNKKNLDFNQLLGQQMTYILPVMMVFFFAKLPAALSLYLLTTTLFSIVQQHLTKTKNIEVKTI